MKKKGIISTCIILAIAIACAAIAGNSFYNKRNFKEDIVTEGSAVTRTYKLSTYNKNLKGTIVLFCHFGIGMAIMGYLTHISPLVLWQNCCMLPSSVTTLITEERVPGEVSFRCIQLGDLSHLYAGHEVPSTAGLFPEIYDGIDNTVPHTFGSQA